MITGRLVRKIINLGYPDDTLIMASCQEEMGIIMRRLQETSEEFGLKLSPNKTSVMIIDQHNNNRPHLRGVAGFEVFHKFVYLGSQIVYKDTCQGEIQHRIAIGQTQTQTMLSNIWKDSPIA